MNKKFVYQVGNNKKVIPYSVGLLWMSDQPVAETSTW
jgi:hypothetical protein